MVIFSALKRFQNFESSQVSPTNIGDINYTPLQTFNITKSCTAKKKNLTPHKSCPRFVSPLSTDTILISFISSLQV